MKVSDGRTARQPKCSNKACRRAWRFTSGCGRAAEEEDTRPRLVRLDAVAVEFQLVHPAVVGRHCLGGNGAAGRDETELAWGICWRMRSRSRLLFAPKFSAAALTASSLGDHTVKCQAERSSLRGHTLRATDSLCLWRLLGK
jgi:hypothetical protein